MWCQCNALRVRTPGFGHGPVSEVVLPGECLAPRVTSGWTPLAAVLNRPCRTRPPPHQTPPPPPRLRPGTAGTRTRGHSCCSLLLIKLPLLLRGVDHWPHLSHDLE